MLVRAFDLHKLYKDVFGRNPYYIEPKGSNEPDTEDVKFSEIPQNPHPRGKIHYTQSGNVSLNKIGAYGQDIWFPVKFVNADIGEIEIENCTTAVNLSKTIIRTPVSERKGSVKECFNIDDYKFTIRGFLIGKGRKFPDEDIDKLRRLLESTQPVELHGGYPELFLDKSCRVAVETLEFPETQGQAHWIRPFTLTCETDYIEDLIMQ